MELQELYALMDRFAVSGLSALEWQEGESRVMLRREVSAVSAPAPASAPTPAAPAEEAREEGGEVVSAPLVGVFYAAPAPGEAPFVSAGAQVKKGDTLCLMEAMKMMSEVPAPADCVVEAVLASDGEAVGFGAPLFRIRRA